MAGGFEEGTESRSNNSSTDLIQLRPTHEEGDTRLILHAMNCKLKTVVVSSKDTDVLVLLLAHFQHMQCEQLWMMSETVQKQRHIPIHEVCKTLPQNSEKSLLAFHALTGCDTTSHFAQHSKKLAWKVFKMHHTLLKDLGIGELDQAKIQLSEAFVCKMYNLPSTTSLDTARHMLFSKVSKSEAMSPTSDAF